MKKIKNKKRNSLIITMIGLFLLGAVMVSYAFIYDIIYIGQNENKIKTCSFDVSFKDENPIQLNNAYPIDANEIDVIDPYTFYIRADRNTCSDMTYNINMYNICDNCNQTNDICTVNENYSCNCNSNYQIDPDLINFQLINTRTNEITTGTNPLNMNISRTLTGTITDTYELKLWIDSSATEEDLYIYENNVPVQNEDGTYKTKGACFRLNLNNASATNLDTSGANAPELATGMIPVYYDNTSNVWKKADSSNENAKYKWYNYDEHMWANAVTVSEVGGSRTDLINANVGTEIPMSRINTMLVWIPRFVVNTGSLSTIDYFNSIRGTATDSAYNNPGAISLTFVDKDTTALDAFTFGSQNLGGYWVGKFEVGNSSGVIVKPNIASWTNVNISTFYNNMLPMKNNTTMYGFNTTTDTTLDTHMIKNNEWGALAYLTQSNYGRCTNGVCSEVWKNPTTTVASTTIGPSITGCSGTSQGSEAQNSMSACTSGYEYNGINNNGNSSTTGNVYGVYDMVGGSYEYVMGNFNNAIRSSGFGSMPNSTYVTIYATSTYVGHALTETQRWYNDYNNFVNSTYAWFVRGGDYRGTGTSGGVFCSQHSEGAADSIVSSRLVITK